MSHSVKKRLKAIKWLINRAVEERVRYDMIASHMQMLGYTDLDIYLEQGPRP